MFTSAISKIWLTGLLLFAALPVLIIQRPVPPPATEQVQQLPIEPTTAATRRLEKLSGQKRNPTSQPAPLATGN